MPRQVVKIFDRFYNLFIFLFCERKREIEVCAVENKKFYELAESL